MQRVRMGLLFLPVSLLIGCGGSVPESKFTTPPHGGRIVELPGSTGYVELKTDREASAKGRSGSPVKSRVIAYFYQPDGASAMSPPPTDVKVTIGAEGRGVAVSLAPQSSEPGQFISEPGDYPDELRGQIDLQHDGKPVTASFTFR